MSIVYLRHSYPGALNVYDIITGRALTECLLRPAVALAGHQVTDFYMTAFLTNSRLIQ